MTQKRLALSKREYLQQFYLKPYKNMITQSQYPDQVNLKISRVILKLNPQQSTKNGSAISLTCYTLA